MPRATPVLKLSERVAITPFWLRLPRFFLYPLSVEPLLYMLLLSSATLLAFLLPLPYPLDLLIVLAGVWLAFTRYAYKTLAQTALGRLHPDMHRDALVGASAALPYKQFAVFLCMGLAGALLASAGPLVVGVFVLFCILALPASVMALTMTGRLHSAINPLTLISTMRAIGWPYLGLCAFLFLLTSSQAVMHGLLLPRLPEFLIMPVYNFVGMYFTLIMFNMMGYVVYQYHHELGVDASVSATDAKSDSKSAAEAKAEVVGRLIAEGRLDAALDLAYEDQRVAPDDLLAHQRYHRLLLLSENHERLLAHGRRYLSALLDKGRGDEALALHRVLQACRADFSPERPSELLPLAEAARRGRDYGASLALLKGFDKRFPRHSDIPAVYLFAARVFCENLRQDASARQILQVLLARYPEHPAALEGRQLLDVIDRLAASPARQGSVA